MEVVTAPVRRALKPNFGVRQIGNRLHDARGMGLCKRPVSHLRAVEVLDRLRSTNRPGPRRRDPIPAVQLVEGQFLRICSASRWPHQIRTVFVITLRHAEQVVSRRLLMREDEGLLAVAMAGLPVKPTFDVGRASLLTPLKHNRSYPAGLPVRLLSLLMNRPLSGLEVEGNNLPGLVRVL